MQDRDMTVLIKTIKKHLRLVKLILLFGILIFIYLKISLHWTNSNWQKWDDIYENIQANWALIVLSGLLMPVNLGLEALKWRLIASEVEKISFKQAFIGVLTGLSIGFITPHALGDYLGRVWQLRNSNRLRSIGGILIGRMMQSVVTLMFGLLGLAIIPDQFSLRGYDLIIIYLLGALLIFVLFYKPSVFLKIFNFRILRQFKKYFQVVEDYSSKAKWIIFLLSFLRYLVFGTQFIIIMYYFGVEGGFEVLAAGVTLIFLAQSIYPSFNFLSDLGIRQVAAYAVFTIVGGDVFTVLLASLLLWAINILIPSIIGSFYILSIKIFRN